MFFPCEGLFRRYSTAFWHLPSKEVSMWYSINPPKSKRRSKLNFTQTSYKPTDFACKRSNSSRISKTLSNDILTKAQKSIASIQFNPHQFRYSIKALSQRLKIKFSFILCQSRGIPFVYGYLFTMPWLNNGLVDSKLHSGNMCLYFVDIEEWDLKSIQLQKVISIWCAIENDKVKTITRFEQKLKL